MKPNFISILCLLVIGGYGTITTFAQEAVSPLGEPVTKAYRVAPSFLSGLINPSSAGAGASDQFAAPEGNGSSPPVGVFQAYISKELGITFPEGTHARLDSKTGRLEIRHQPGVAEATEAYLTALEGYSQRQLNLRAEICQMPALVALKVQQLCGPLDDHVSIWESVQGMVERGQATVVTTTSVIARSGQRAKAQDISETIYPTEVDWDKEQKTVLPAAFETRNVGTTFEVDPVIGGDDYTIDLNLNLEHHTSPPVMRPISVTSPNSGHVVTVEMPEFHAKSITTQITIGAGGVKCLGA